MVSQWNHGSWEGGAKGLPVGVGEIFERGNEAVIKGEFNLASTDGRETYQTVKYLHEKGRRVEWSYALPDTDWRMEERDGQQVRAFTRISVPEVSPVLMGSGVDTRLLSIKSASSDEPDAPDDAPQKQIPSKRLAEHIDEAVQSAKQVTRRATIVRALREAEGRTISRAARERLEKLSGALHDAESALDQLLAEPEEHDDSDELRQIELATYERRSS